ncbi:rhodanese-like domain-containing protein [Demequina sp. NBRC 110051]|uniref:rhodanese-like domain-containing protein n=1 Tax=Demequina sp. NBRC 110051 TaxID=1570340 RepID=UPI000A002CBC|nr:rhodanese-like domain-containing protein [Demequina sp. NBRC 110051]
MSGYAGDLTPAQAWELLTSNPDARLVDVRTEAEWRFVGVPDTSATGKEPILVEWASYPAMSRNEAFVDQLLAAGLEPGSDAPVVFLCRSGQRSIGGAMAATEAGIGPSYNILDGFEGGPDSAGHRGAQGWKAEGLPWHQG